MEGEQELTGTIVKLLHPKDEGFIQYHGDKLIFFKSNYKRFFKTKKRGTWQIGDTVKFYIKEDEIGRIYATIVCFVENPALEELMLNVQQEDCIVLKGSLKVFDGDLFFQESSFKFIFAVRYLTVSDINIAAENEYEAILNMNESSRMVVLSEWLKLCDQLKIKKRNREIISSTVIEVRMDYLKISIPGTPFYGKVLGYDKTKEYREGDNIDLYTFPKHEYKYFFSDSTYRRSDNLSTRPPVRGNEYQAIITGYDEKYYQIDIIGEYFNGVLPKIFWEQRQKYEVGEAVDVIYAKRANDLRYLFFTTQQFAKIEERAKKRKQRKISSNTL